MFLGATQLRCDQNPAAFLSKGFTMTTRVVVQQPESVNGLEFNQWGSKICDCCDDLRMCCFAFWCPICFESLTLNKLGESYLLSLVDYTLSPFVPAITMAARQSMRHLYGIEGSMCNDCVLSTFCRWCVWCQMAREMKKRSSQIVFVNDHTRNRDL
ncbi:cornifelin homolog [Corythoichthys intestinalis]|uniref:cornifelin homolog n=1 Tax=Corythoichthys intestinalis TaxID=161448 RepID=UPI0025A681F6|nr:cornifelin homolog [Corythoichthys intestinalis]